MEKSRIYGICCIDCKKIYIEQTKRSVERRLEEHLKEVVFAEQKEAKVFRSEITSQSWSHSFQGERYSDETRRRYKDIRCNRNSRSLWNRKRRTSQQGSEQRILLILQIDRETRHTGDENVRRKQSWRLLKKTKTNFESATTSAQKHEMAIQCKGLMRPLQSHKSTLS